MGVFSMLWFFERDTERVTIETRYDNETSELVVVLQWPDGRVHAERFLEEGVCQGWLRQIGETLRDQGWTPDGPPVILPYGWKEKKR
jgi:hypothetical protein